MNEKSGTSTAIGTLRQKTANVRRAHILEAAVSVFAERGFHRATIRDVAKAAGISDGAIYTVFANKDALLLGMLDPLGDAEGPPAAIPDDVAAFVCDLVDRRWRAFTPHTLPMLRVVLSEVLVDRKLRALFTTRVIAPALTLPEPPLQALADAGQLAADDVAMTLRIMTGAFLGLLVLRLLGDDVLEAHADGVPGALAKILLHGLLPRPREEAKHGTV